MDLLLEHVWVYQFPLVPVLLAVIVAEAPFWVRRWQNFMYAPVYAPILVEELNEDLSLYYGTDFVGRGETLTDGDLERLRRRLSIVAFSSMFLSAVITPLYAGIATAFFLDPGQFLPFLATWGSYRAYRCWLSFRDFGTHAFAGKSALRTLQIVYFLYVCVTSQLAYEGYEWARPFVEAGDFLGIAHGISSVVFSDGIVAGIVVAGASTVFSNLLIDPKFREQQLAALRRHSDYYRAVRYPSPTQQATGASASEHQPSAPSGPGPTSSGVLPSSSGVASS